jgi:hypothetical protein
MLLAKLYFNAKVYTGTERYDETMEVCNDIINNGGYTLEPDFFSNFSADNTGTNELIFAIPYDQVFYSGFNLSMQTLHYGSQDSYNLTSQPWNGFCTLEEFYNSFATNDLRRGDPGTLDGPAKKRGSFLAGYQYKSNGQPVVDDGWEQPDPTHPEKQTDPDGEKVNFSPFINELGPNAIRQAGARIGKWEFALGGTPDMNNDLAVFRYSDVLLMKAEAVWRKTNNSGDAIALALVNQVRTRANLDPVTTLDAPLSFDKAAGPVPGGELFNERGRELFAEHTRRQDLIRWGYFTAKEASADRLKWGLPTRVVGDTWNFGNFTIIYPIPRIQLEAGSNLTQNPGY